MRLITLALLFLTQACALEPKEFEVPSDLIPQDSMVMILKDMSILESFTHQKYIQLERYAMLLRMSGDSLLQDYGVNRDRYERSMEYYGKNPQRFMDIYDSVIFQLDGGKVNSSPFEAMEQF